MTYSVLLERRSRQSLPCWTFERRWTPWAHACKKRKKISHKKTRYNKDAGMNSTMAFNIH